MQSEIDYLLAEIDFPVQKEETSGPYPASNSRATLGPPLAMYGAPSIAQSASPPVNQKNQP